MKELTSEGNVMRLTNSHSLEFDFNSGKGENVLGGVKDVDGVEDEVGNTPSDGSIDGDVHGVVVSSSDLSLFDLGIQKVAVGGGSGSLSVVLKVGEDLVGVSQSSLGRIKTVSESQNIIFASYFYLKIRG